MKHQLLIVLGTLFASLVVATAAEPIQLFNGKDLTGWAFDVQDNADPQTIWSVQDGLLICKGKPAGVIRTESSGDIFPHGPTLESQATGPILTTSPAACRRPLGPGCWNR